jgi:hypothetical protein
MGGKIRVELVGGLGNQLNCYFAGLYYAMAYNYSEIILNFGNANRSHINPTDLKLVIPEFIEYDNGKTLKVSIIDVPRNAKLLGKLRRFGFLGYGVYKFIVGRFEDSRLIEFETSRYHKLCDRKLKLLGIRARRNLVLDGFFHSFRFYDGVKIRVTQFESLIELSKTSVNLLTFGSQNAPYNKTHCTIHLRVSDFRTPGQMVFGVLSESYYLRAIDLVSQKYPGILFKLTSDNNSLAQKLYPNVVELSEGFYEDSDKQSPLKSFEILRNSKVVICANSGFSFWAVKLSTNNELCIIPANLHVTLIGCRNIPNHWTRIENEFI